MADFRKVKMKATSIHLAGNVPEAHWDDLLSETSWSSDDRLEIMRLARERLAAVPDSFGERDA